MSAVAQMAAKREEDLKESYMEELLCKNYVVGVVIGVVSPTSTFPTGSSKGNSANSTTVEGADS